MVKFPEADARFFRNMFVCRKCKTRRRVPSIKVAQGNVVCRKCHSRALRAVRKK
jgi:ribosomal protein L40E